jgi:hypothetical protein
VRSGSAHQNEKGLLNMMMGMDGSICSLYKTKIHTLEKNGQDGNKWSKV